MGRFLLSADSTEFFRGCLGMPCQHSPDPGVSLAYALELGYYMYALPALLLWDRRLKDFSVLMAHHIVTIALIALSGVSGMVRVGVVIMALHDVCDVLLETSKICRWFRGSGATKVPFVAFLCVWIATRLVYFPLHVLRSVLVESWGLIFSPDAPAPRWQDYVAFYGFAGLLLALFAMHVYWTTLIAAIVRRAITGARLEDVREADTKEE